MSDTPRDDATGPEPRPEKPIEIAPEQLSGPALSALVESFILREGTDYGAQEVSLIAKKAQVMRQLHAGEVKIFFDLEHETCTLTPARDGMSPGHVPPDAG